MSVSFYGGYVTGTFGGIFYLGQMEPSFTNYPGIFHLTIDTAPDTTGDIVARLVYKHKKQ